jgi:hypothetical protein
LRSGVGFVEKAMVLGVVDDDTAAKIASRGIGLRSGLAISASTQA